MSVVDQLQISDARAALGFAADIADCADAAQLATQLPGLVGAEGVIMTASRDWMGEMAVKVGDPALYSADILAGFGRGWRDHPVMVPDLAAASLATRRLSDHIAPREWRRRGLFNGFYRPLGMRHELSTQMAWGPAGSSCCVALHRSGRDFGGRELALLELVAPHLRAARARIAAEARSARRDAFPDVGRSAVSPARRLPITAREAEVLARLAAGRTNGGIAADLGISPNTVARHVEHIYGKLGVHTRVAATRAALDVLGD
jgi:DNA-binding CsgD family transcriptional regulator